LLDGICNIVLLDTEQSLVGCKRPQGSDAPLSNLSALALTEPDAARAPLSGSLRRFDDLVEKLQNCKKKCKILRFFEIRPDSIAARGALQQDANTPEGRLQSTWNEIAIPVANSGFPSVSRRFDYTLFSVDEAGAIGVTWDCANRQKLIYCASRRGDLLGNSGTFFT
jgi:hypothetical protein